MAFPAVAIAICFTSGIAMGLWPMAANRASSRGFYFGELAAVLLAITLRTCSLPSRWIKRFSFALLLAAAVTLATFPFAPRWQRGSFELSVLDVGQGDSLFLVFPAGHTILVDAGGSFSAIRHLASKCVAPIQARKPFRPIYGRADSSRSTW